MMKPSCFSLLALLVLPGCGSEGNPRDAHVQAPGAAGRTDRGPSLPEARRGFETKILRRSEVKEPLDDPPAALFRVVHYDSPVGKLAAYLSPAPGDGRRHPAILWLFGGFRNGIGATAWEEAPADNDQSASAFRKAGIVMMYPSLRGGNENPGVKEAFFGEVDDLLAAADYLARQDFVDPNRIYLGGHSTGATLALLAAAASAHFRAVFALGPVADVGGYGAQNLPFDLSNPRELELRSPRLWMRSIQSPVFAFEGTEEPANLHALQSLAHASTSSRIRCFAVPGANHFSVIAPLTQLCAEKILGDDGATTRIAFTQQELDRLVPR